MLPLMHRFLKCKVSAGRQRPLVVYEIVLSFAHGSLFSSAVDTGLLGNDITDAAAAAKAATARGIYYI